MSELDDPFRNGHFNYQGVDGRFFQLSAVIADLDNLKITEDFQYDWNREGGTVKSNHIFRAFDITIPEKTFESGEAEIIDAFHARQLWGKASVERIRGIGKEGLRTVEDGLSRENSRDKINTRVIFHLDGLRKTLRASMQQRLGPHGQFYLLTNRFMILRGVLNGLKGMESEDRFWKLAMYVSSNQKLNPTLRRWGFLPVVTLGADRIAACPYCKDDPKGCFQERILVMTANLMPVLKMVVNQSFTSTVYIRRVYLCTRTRDYINQSEWLRGYVVEEPVSIMQRYSKKKCGVCKAQVGDKGNLSEGVKIGERGYFCHACLSLVNFTADERGLIELDKEHWLHIALQHDTYFVYRLIDVLWQIAVQGITKRMSCVPLDERPDMDLRSMLMNYFSHCVPLDEKPSIDLRSVLMNYFSHMEKSKVRSIDMLGMDYLIMQTWHQPRIGYFLRLMNHIEQNYKEEYLAMVGDRTRLEKRFSDTRKRLEIMNDKTLSPDQRRNAMMSVHFVISPDGTNLVY